MKSYIYIVFCLSCLSCSNDENQFLVVIENENSGIEIRDLNEVDCSVNGNKVVISETLEFNRSEFGSLSLIGQGDSLYFNIEKFQVNDRDTLRVSNFGGRKISKIGAQTVIKETLCKFFNK